MSEINPGSITIRPDGPYRVEGGVPLEGPDGQAYELKPAYSLCRCGQSSNKPYCDGTHKECGFVGAESAESADSGELAVAGEVRAALIHVVRDGPYEVIGVPVLTLSDGRVCQRRPYYRLCRCGASKSKPFCDDSHVEVGFQNG